MRLATPFSEIGHAARFGRDDRLGLAVALALHVVLVLILALWDKDAPKMDVPDRIAVTVSDEIALESISPNPMANPAPSVGAEIGEAQQASQAVQSTVAPREVAETRPALVPAPSQTRAQPAAPSKPQPADRSDRRRPDAPSQGSRIGNDFLTGTGGRGSDADQPAARAGPLTAASLSSAISRQLRPHWNAPQGVDAEKLVTILSWQMNADGSLKGRPQVVSQAGITDSNSAQADRHAELAIRAVQLAAPFDLPREYYDQWKNVSSFRFDRRL
ncbi:hypothetical protein [Croceicoccus naphthovorans]|uniref:Uncharacterized protein n=1 Tax=Croceicoccus naphthovorans TaxID=1348774 RepID=A0A0G3XGU2_9SPHN|nr:hypothetical protein [Croceicoccus naphthovorans]AKM09839.1 hypothetical protein AB433_07340 [Croceicoccus naphthovorans]MBB3991281.1 hypothetical protein [Croceicoccus naphthovorans]